MCLLKNKFTLRLLGNKVNKIPCFRLVTIMLEKETAERNARTCIERV